MFDQSRPNRAVPAGIVATLFGLGLLQLAPAVGSPAIHLAMWAGSFLSLNLAFATVAGRIILLGLGIGGAALYARHLRPRLPGPPLIGGLAFGGVLWLVNMTVVLPLFDRMSPLVQQGLMMAPGVFSWRWGRGAWLVWFLASAGYGAALGVLLRGVPAA